jgi:hypothetical protein
VPLPWGCVWGVWSQAAGPWLVSSANAGQLTPLGDFLEALFMEVDKGASGTIVRLGIYYYVCVVVPSPPHSASPLPLLLPPPPSSTLCRTIAHPCCPSL